MENFSCKKCNVIANSLSSSCPSCGDKFYSMNDRQRILGIATLVCIAIATGSSLLYRVCPQSLEGFEMDMGLTWKKLLGEGMSNQQIETMLLLGIVPIILLTIWFMVFLYNNLAPELEK